jgi:hypothetical protein
MLKRLRLTRACFGVYEIAWLEAGCIAVQGSVNLVRDMWSADRLSMTSCLIHILTQTLLQVLRRAASILKSLQFCLVLKDNSGSGLAISPATIADLPKPKIQICARHTHPVTNTLGILLLCSLMLELLLLLLRGECWNKWNCSSWLELCLQRLRRGRLITIILLLATVFSCVWAFELDISLLFSLLTLSVGLGCLLAQQMIRLAIEVLLRLLLLAAVALLTAEEIVILATTADPTTVRKIKFVFGRGVLLLSFGGILRCANLFSFNFN